MKRLGVNIDHIATLRNARGGFHPDPILAARLAIKCGADLVTIHLREDRRHIKDQDLIKICKNKNDVKKFVNKNSLPIVVKADGLAAGKGVSICKN